MNNPNDAPGKITLEFQTQQQCEQSLKSMTYWLKFEKFKIEKEKLRNLNKEEKDRHLPQAKERNKSFQKAQKCLEEKRFK
jgi:hypothetical protein